MKTDIKKAAKLMKLATFCSMSVALAIISIKVAAWILTDSLSLLSSLVDSVMDVAASLISFMAVRYALQPADEDHRFGHGRAEDIAAFSQSMFIAGSGMFIIMEAIGRFVHPRQVQHEMIGIWVMVVSSVLTVGLLLLQRYVISKTDSSVIKADTVHYQTDLLVNLVVIFSFVAAMMWEMHFLDPVLAFVIALYIFISAWKVGREAFDKLMDKEFSDEDREKIIKAVLSHKKAKGLHDLRTRSLGIKPFIQLHLELDGKMSLAKAHAISDEIEEEILKIFPNAEVLIHQDIEGKEHVKPEQGRVVSLP